MRSLTLIQGGRSETPAAPRMAAGLAPAEAARAGEACATAWQGLMIRHAIDERRLRPMLAAGAAIVRPVQHPAAVLIDRARAEEAAAAIHGRLAGLRRPLRRAGTARMSRIEAVRPAGQRRTIPADRAVGVRPAEEAAEAPRSAPILTLIAQVPALETPVEAHTAKQAPAVQIPAGHEPAVKAPTAKTSLVRALGALVAKGLGAARRIAALRRGA